MSVIYKIGTAVDNMQDVRNLLECAAPPNPTTFREYQEFIGQDLAALPVEMGFPNFTWQYEFLSPEDFNIFLGLCPGAYAWVYAQTRKNDNTAGVFHCLMGRPTADSPKEGFRYNVQIPFILAIEV